MPNGAATSREEKKVEKAIRNNTFFEVLKDEGIDYKETEMVELNGRRFLVHHIVDPQAPHDKIKRKIIRENPDVVVFGHTHKPFCETIGNTLYFNPGYAGKQRFSLERSVAVLHCDGAGITAEYTSL